MGAAMTKHDKLEHLISLWKQKDEHRELMRRLRLGDLRKLLRDRNGPGTSWANMR